MITISNVRHPYTLNLTEKELDTIKLALEDALDHHSMDDIYAPSTVGLMENILSEIHGIMQ